MIGLSQCRSEPKGYGDIPATVVGAWRFGQGSFSRPTGKEAKRGTCRAGLGGRKECERERITAEFDPQH